LGGIVKKIKPSPRKPITRLKKPYEGGDTLMEWHREKYKSSLSEACKDADYATPIWRCETDAERGWRMIKAFAGIVLGIGLAYVFAFAFIDWLKRG
jgi:hypothetical protein